MTAPDERGAALPPHPPPRRLPANEWLPPLDFLPPERRQETKSSWVSWVAPPRPPQRPRDAGSPQQSLDSLVATRDADLVYDSMDELAAAFHARLATLIDVPEFRAWQRSNPTFKPRLSGLLWTAQGPRRITVLLDTGATHCFICAHLAAALNLAPSGQPGPGSVTTVATGGTRDLAAPVQIFLSMVDVLRESLSVSPMDRVPGTWATT